MSAGLRRIALRSRAVALAGMCAALYSLPGAMVSAQQSASTLVEPTAVAGPPSMRRLTESQYRATIADVFGPGTPIAGRFERALREDGLVAIGTSKGAISAFSFEQYDASARGIAADVTGEKRRETMVPCKPTSETMFDAACAGKFVDLYGMRLFRRPLRREERAAFVQTAQAAQTKLGGFYKGLEYALTGMLESPNFLLRIEATEPDPAHPGQIRLTAWSRATRLSYFLTNSTPDEELLRAAGAGELDTDAGLARQVDRLLASPKLEGAVRAFFWDMLQFDGFNDLAKDPTIYPTYNSDVARDAQEQTLRTIVAQLLTDRGDYRDLFTTRRTFLTRPLGIVYGQPVATRNGWEAAEYPAESGRSGILTDISMLALYSHPGRSSPTLRGKSIRELLLCQHVPDPPPNVDFTVVQDSSNTKLPTVRVRLEAHRTNPVCAGCHRITDPIGLTLENFDGVGGYRDQENGAAIDVSGTLDSTDFKGAQGLGKALHDSADVPQCLVTKLYRSAVGREESAAENPYLEFLNRSFQGAGYRLPALMRTIALSREFYAVAPAPAPATTGGKS